MRILLIKNLATSIHVLEARIMAVKNCAIQTCDVEVPLLQTYSKGKSQLSKAKFIGEKVKGKLITRQF